MKSVIALSAAVTMVVAIACGSSRDPTKTPSGGRASCQADAECVMTNKGTGCCTSCPGVPHAIPTLAFEQHKNRCADAQCGPTNDRIECPVVEKLEAFVAKCKDGTCAAVKR